MTMRYKLLACKVLQRELASLLPGCKNCIDLTMIQQDLHNRPRRLTEVLQAEIDAIDENRDVHSDDLSGKPIDAILLGYGLCSNAVEGLRSKKYTLVIPRAHDCVTLLLGSRERYADYFDAHPGTYYWTQGWMDANVDLSERVLQEKYTQYCAEYGDDPDTVEYLMEMERSMLQHYNRLCCITWPHLPDMGALVRARTLAGEKQWTLDLQNGEDSLLRALLNGDWDEARFLIVPPGKAIAPSWDEDILQTAE